MYNDSEYQELRDRAQRHMHEAVTELFKRIDAMRFGTVDQEAFAKGQVVDTRKDSAHQLGVNYNVIESSTGQQVGEFGMTLFVRKSVDNYDAGSLLAMSVSMPVAALSRTEIDIAQDAAAAKSTALFGEATQTFKDLSDGYYVGYMGAKEMAIDTGTGIVKFAANLLPGLYLVMAQREFAGNVLVTWVKGFENQRMFAGGISAAAVCKEVELQSGSFFTGLYAATISGNIVSCKSTHFTVRCKTDLYVKGIDIPVYLAVRAVLDQKESPLSRSHTLEIIFPQ